MRTFILSLLMLMGVSLTMCSCLHDTDEPMEKEEPTPNPDPTPTTDSGKAVVVYFSCTNTTKDIADKIAEISGADSYRIIPEMSYTDADLNYNNSSCRANREQNDPSARPAIKGKCENIGDYDIIFLGYPIWWGEAPKVIYTFLEGHNLDGKTVIPFCTSHSSGIGSSDTNLHGLASGAQWKQGRRFGGGESKETIEKWIESIGLTSNKNTDG